MSSDGYPDRPGLVVVALAALALMFAFVGMVALALSLLVWF